jgi:hypothetical protein
MRCLHPPLFAIGLWLFSWGTASAQASFEAAAPNNENAAPVARDCDRALEAHVTNEAGATAAAPSEAGRALPRVRTLTDGLDTIVSQALVRSATFRRLVQTIDRTDGIVYVEPGKCPHGVRACLLDVRKSGRNRLVRIRVKANADDWDLMGSVAHELQHAVEVLSNSAITSTIAMQTYYMLEARRINQVFETEAAVRTGNTVRAEVRRRPRHTGLPDAGSHDGSTRWFTREPCPLADEPALVANTGF